MTIDDSLDGQAFEVFIENFLVPELWVGAVVVRDNLPADKMASIAPLTEAVGEVLLTYNLLILILLNYGGRNLNLFWVSFLQLQQK
jgi:hypothetical protein